MKKNHKFHPHCKNCNGALAILFDDRDFAGYSDNGKSFLDNCYCRTCAKELKIDPSEFLVDRLLFFK
jgi:hypothetical protein